MDNRMVRLASFASTAYNHRTTDNTIEWLCMSRHDATDLNNMTRDDYLLASEHLDMDAYKLADFRAFADEFAGTDWYATWLDIRNAYIEDDDRDLRAWQFDNGIRVNEDEHNGFLHKFTVHDGDRLLGYVYPGVFEDMCLCIAHLDAGEDPVSYSWEDGCGNNCIRSGWGFDTWGWELSDDEQTSLIIAARANEDARKNLLDYIVSRIDECKRYETISCEECQDAYNCETCAKSDCIETLEIMRDVITAESDADALEIYWNMHKNDCVRFARMAQNELTD